MAFRGKATNPYISDKEYAERKAAADAEIAKIAEDTSKLLQQGENIDELRRKADELEATTIDAFKPAHHKTAKPKGKSFFASLFCCFPCGNKNENDGNINQKPNERTPLLPNRRK